MRYLILGCGPAGIAAAKAIRKSDKSASVVIATEESGPSYLRPLLPDLITGEMGLSAIRDPRGEGAKLSPRRLPFPPVIVIASACG